MDLPTITALLPPQDRDALSAALAPAADPSRHPAAHPGGLLDVTERGASGTAVLAGGTWLFSVQQPHLRTLVDLTALGWPALEVLDGPVGLRIGATCTIAELAALPPQPGWAAHPLVGACCRALLASFKVWTTATVGGNICLALPAGAMTSLTAALDGVAVLWGADGGERRTPVADLVRGDMLTALAPGEVLRAVEVPLTALRARTAVRTESLSPVGRSAVLVVARLDEDGGFVLTITASTPRPVQLRTAGVPGAEELRAAVEAAVGPRAPTDWFDDVHGAPDWRRALTLRAVEQVRAELAAPAPAAPAPAAPSAAPSAAPASAAPSAAAAPAAAPAAGATGPTTPRGEPS